jgi:hypothetical protein
MARLKLLQEIPSSDASYLHHICPENQVAYFGASVVTTTRICKTAVTADAMAAFLFHFACSLMVAGKSTLSPSCFSIMSTFAKPDRFS